MQDERGAIVGDDGRVRGEISFENASLIEAQGSAILAGSPGEVVAFDLSGLTETNSITVAVMMAWYRAADQAGTEVEFRGVAPGVRRIIEFSGLSELLLPDAANATR